MKSILTICVLVFSVSSAAQENGERVIESSEITAVVRKHFPENAQGGLALLVTKDNVVIHSKGYGTEYGKTPVTPQSRMPLASISKQFAAMCAAILIDEGKLGLTDKVTKHLPNFKDQGDGRDLLIQDLIWHINGLPNFINSDEKTSIAEFKKARGLERLSNKTHAEWLATMPVRRKPGIEFEYTNSGYVLLARIIEVVANQPFHEFQKERIFDVLKMDNTTDSTRFNGSGNMMLSIEDYAKWDRALWNHFLLSEQTAELIFQRGRLDNGDPVAYGFGWRVEYDDTGELIEAFHGGVGSPKRNARNIIIRDIQDRITVALFVRENLKFKKTYRRAVAEEIRNVARGD